MTVPDPQPPADEPLDHGRPSDSRSTGSAAPEDGSTSPAPGRPPHAEPVPGSGSHHPSPEPLVPAIVVRPIVLNEELLPPRGLPSMPPGTLPPGELPPRAMPSGPVPSGSTPPGAVPPGFEARPLPPLRRQRRIWLPLFLFVATCVSTFWAGVAGESAAALVLGDLTSVFFLLQQHWRDGLFYMSAVMSILLAHEMGHFLFTLWHRVPASFPFFIPMPLTAIGTMGAVIGMQSRLADRRQLFDIGLAGPLAGLVLAIPVTVMGVIAGTPVPADATPGTIYHDPLLVKLLIYFLRPDVETGEIYMNPALMAGWVGMVVTGLNMLPVSQLDGGHICYALFGRRAHLVARLFVLAAVLFVIVARAYGWIVMLVLLTLIGVDHPPTANDRIPLGKLRWLLGLASLIIPVLCFPPRGISVMR